MKLNNLILLLSLFVFTTINAQKNNKSGIISYQKTYYEIDTLAYGGLAEEALLFNEIETSYFYVKFLKSFDNPELKSPPIEPRVIQYQNFSTKTMISAIRVPKGSYIVHEDMTVITWRILNKSKKIQNIECFGAIAEYRGRVWTAWYAPSIPISSGPWKLYGLPGMILEAEDMKRYARFNCLSVDIPFNGNMLIEIPEHKDKNRKDKLVGSIEFALMYKNNIALAEKMSIQKNMYGEDKTNFGVADIEIFDFEKELHSTVKRFQQKLSDIPKK